VSTLRSTMNGPGSASEIQDLLSGLSAQFQT
jgi:hypothetical protein